MRTLVIPLGLAAAMLVPAASAQDALPLPPPPSPAAAASPPIPASRQAEAGMPAESTGVLTLDSALALAVAYNDTLRAARHEVAASDGGVLQAGLLPNPEVAVQMEDTREASRTLTGQLNLPIELGGKRAARVSAAQKARELALAQLAGTQASLRAAVSAAFFELLIAQERVTLARGTLGIAAEGMQAAARRVAAGKIAPLEETKARVEQANAELELSEATAGLARARQALSSLWGSPVPGFGEAGGDLQTVPAAPADVSLAGGLDAAPALLASRREMERRQAEIEVERSRQYPDLTVSLGAKRDNGSGRGAYPVLGISLPLPLFDRNQGRLYTALRQADKAADEYRATRVRLDTELRQAASRLAVARTSAETLRATVLPGAQQAYGAARRGFEAGKFTYLDVLDAQRTLFQARIRYLGVLAGAYQAAAAIDGILGR